MIWSGLPVPSLGHVGVGSGSACDVLESLPSPHLTAYLDDLACTAQRRVETNPVEALDDLRPGSAKAE